jgi:hypothetical protein
VNGVLKVTVTREGAIFAKVTRASAEKRQLYTLSFDFAGQRGMDLGNSALAVASRRKGGGRWACGSCERRQEWKTVTACSWRLKTRTGDPSVEQFKVGRYEWTICR